MLNRRGLITSLLSVMAAPAIVRAASLMPVKRIPLASNTIFVDGAAIHPGDGSLTTPFQTLQQTMDFINTDIDLRGQQVTVQLASGEYDGAIFRGPPGTDLFICGNGTDQTFIKPYRTPMV